MVDRRSHDPLLIELKTQFADFVDRYCREMEAAKEWRNDTTTRLKVHCDFIKEVSPVYKRLCWVLGAAMVVSIGIVVTSFWGHVTWHP